MVAAMRLQAPHVMAAPRSKGCPITQKTPPKIPEKIERATELTMAVMRRALTFFSELSGVIVGEGSEVGGVATIALIKRPPFVVERRS